MNCPNNTSSGRHGTKRFLCITADKTAQNKEFGYFKGHADSSGAVDCVVLSCFQASSLLVGLGFGSIECTYSFL